MCVCVCVWGSGFLCILGSCSRISSFLRSVLSFLSFFLPLWFNFCRYLFSIPQCQRAVQGLFLRGSWAQSGSSDTPGGSKNTLCPVDIPLKKGASGAKRWIKPCRIRWEHGEMVPWGPKSVNLSRVTWMLGLPGTHIRRLWPTTRDTQTKLCRPIPKIYAIFFLYPQKSKLLLQSHSNFSIPIGYFLSLRSLVVCPLTVEFFESRSSVGLE